MGNITDDFTVTPDGDMTYHGDNPVNANMIFNPGDSLVRALRDKAEWDGESRPPVGAICEFKINETGWDAWSECLVMGYYDDLVWVTIHHYDSEGSYSGSHVTLIVSDYTFRPIKSDKEKAIEEMLALDPYDPNSYPMTSRIEFCGILYDAKYRIQESDDE